MLKTVGKKFQDLHKRFKGFFPDPLHPSPNVCGNLSRGFCVILLTNKPTNGQGWKHNPRTCHFYCFQSDLLVFTASLAWRWIVFVFSARWLCERSGLTSVSNIQRVSFVFQIPPRLWLTNSWDPWLLMNSRVRPLPHHPATRFVFLTLKTTFPPVEPLQCVLHCLHSLSFHTLSSTD